MRLTGDEIAQAMSGGGMWETPHSKLVKRARGFLPAVLGNSWLGALALLVLWVDMLALSGLGRPHMVTLATVSAVLAIGLTVYVWYRAFGFLRSRRSVDTYQSCPACAYLNPQRYPNCSECGARMPGH